MQEQPFVKYHSDGTVEVFGNDGGYPRISAVVPAPDINTKSEEERQKRHDDACDGITLQGLLIISKRRIRNTAFDKRWQKTTLSIKYRPARNKKEVQEVFTRIRGILQKKFGTSYEVFTCPYRDGLGSIHECRDPEERKFILCEQNLRAGCCPRGLKQ